MPTPTSSGPPRDLLSRLDDALMWTGLRRLAGQELAENEDPACQFWITAREIGGRLCLSASFVVTAGAPSMLVNVPPELLLKAIEEFGDERHDPLESDDDFTFAGEAEARECWDRAVAVAFAQPFVRRTEKLAQVYDTQEAADAAIARAGRGWDPKRIEGRSIAPASARVRAVA